MTNIDERNATHIRTLGEYIDKFLALAEWHHDPKFRETCRDTATHCHTEINEIIDSHYLTLRTD